MTLKRKMPYVLILGLSALILTRPAIVAAQATDEWVQSGISRSRNGYVLVATKDKNSRWLRAFFHNFPGTAFPFLSWDKDKRALLVGANYSAYVPGDILWDARTRRYRLV